LWCYGPGTEETRPPHENAVRDHIRQGVWVVLGEVTGGVERRLHETIHGQIRDGDTFVTRQRLIEDQRGFFEFLPEVMGGENRPRGIPDAPFAVDSAYREGFRTLARICEDNGIILLIRLTPVFAGDAPENFDALLSWARELKSEYPDVIFGYPEVLLFDRPFFWDKRHCNGKGAEKFTALLADEVKKTIAMSGSAAGRRASRFVSQHHTRRTAADTIDGR
jgi:hypothetical protein